MSFFSIFQWQKLFTASKMRMPNFSLILIAITLFHFEFSTKEVFEDVHAINVKILVRSNIIILLTTIIKTKTLKTFSFIDQSKVISILSFKKSADTCTSRSNLITKVISTITSTSSTSVIYTITTIIFITIDDVSSCNATNPFKFISSLKQMSLKNFQVNNSIQIFEVHCNHNAFALASNNNLDLLDFQIISTSNIMICIISCAIYNHQRLVEYKDWISLCSVISLMTNKCYLKTNTNLSHKTDVVSWKNAHMTFLRLW